ncbi:MAG: hypothetical protein EBU08_22485 [Micrococcales bacterium]|jgi:hypothetical protein|nr:hypothetical protein [Micrococcales bacterium]
MLDYLNNYLSLHLKSLNEDLEQLSNKMDSIDPNSKEFGELDFEYNFVSGQASATSHIIAIIMEKEEEYASNQ